MILWAQSNSKSILIEQQKDDHEDEKQEKQKWQERSKVFDEQGVIVKKERKDEQMQLAKNEVEKQYIKREKIESIHNIKTQKEISLGKSKKNKKKQLSTRCWTDKDKVMFRNDDDEEIKVNDLIKVKYTHKRPGEDNPKIKESIERRPIYLIVLNTNDELEDIDLEKFLTVVETKEDENEEQENDNGSDKNEEEIEWDSKENLKNIVKEYKKMYESDNMNEQFTFMKLHVRPWFKHLEGVIKDGIVIRWYVLPYWRQLVYGFMNYLIENNLIYQNNDKFVLWEIAQIFKNDHLKKLVNKNCERYDRIVQTYEMFYNETINGQDVRKKRNNSTQANERTDYTLDKREDVRHGMIRRETIHTYGNVTPQTHYQPSYQASGSGYRMQPTQPKMGYYQHQMSQTPQLRTFQVSHSQTENTWATTRDRNGRSRNRNDRYRWNERDRNRESSVDRESR